MSEPHHITVQVGLAQQLNELAREVRDLRELLAEKEKTNQILLDQIVGLRREVARLEAQEA